MKKDTLAINLIKEMDNLWAYAHKLESKIAELDDEVEQLEKKRRTLIAEWQS